MDAKLATRSPFLPPESEVATTAPDAVLEFFGYIEGNDGIRYRVNDTARKTGVWIKLNEPNSDFGLVAKQHDANRDLLLVEHQGRPLSLPLRRSKIATSGGLPNPSAIPSSAPGPTPRPAATSASSSEQQRQLELLAASVAQRRAGRAQLPTAAAEPVPLTSSQPRPAAP